MTNTSAQMDIATPSAASRYAIVDGKGKVSNVVMWDGVSDFALPEGNTTAAVPDEVGVAEGWSFEGGIFSAPVLPKEPADPLVTYSNNTAERDALLGIANRVVPALQDAIDLGDESANPDLLKAWRVFRVAVNKVDLSAEGPTWPDLPA